MKKPNGNKVVKSIRHEADKRAHIPSAEEAGYESGNVHVQGTPDPRTFSLNPIIHRGQDPELNWLDKYKPSELRVPVRSLYRHEHIAPESIIKGLYRIVEEKSGQGALFSIDQLFGNATTHEELDKVSDYYIHSDGWTNRLIQGDSLLCMTSLLEREGMAGAVQCIYIDPPYGIKYGSNWQVRLNSRTVTDGQDDSLTGEPEQIKAFRDTYALGIHSYLSYLRDRLLVAKELLHESGSCFVQISDENVHLVRCLMDEVFGSGNFVSLISFVTTSGFETTTLARNGDYLIWYAKERSTIKYRQLYLEKDVSLEGGRYRWLKFPDGTARGVKAREMRGEDPLPVGARLYQPTSLISQGAAAATSREFRFEDKPYDCGPGNHWKTTIAGLENLAKAQRIHVAKNSIRYVRYADDFPQQPITNFWDDTATGNFTEEKIYTVQTATKAIQRCILMTTDPGDLVLDPTCGSGTTAYVAEQWGRRWITTDTSRIALNIAKTRLMTATFPFYTLYDTEVGELAVAQGKGKPGEHDSLKDKDSSPALRGCNVRYGFVYKKVPHITLGSIANNEPAAEETLYDQPLEDKKRLRVAGPFTVETLQSYEPISPEELARQREDVEELGAFEDLIFEHLKSAGVKTGDKSEQAVFTRIDRLSSSELHAEGYYPAGGKEKKAYLHIGPKFGPVSKQAVNEAIKACRGRHDADWLMILGFAFESGLSDVTTKDFGSFKVSIVRMHDDLLQEGLLKKDKKAASFVTIGEPDIRLHRKNGTATVEIAGLDIYDPIKDEVKSRNVRDINYWMLDDDYDGSNFVVRQVFFCGGDKDEFDAWKKQLSNLAANGVKKKAEQTLKIELDDEAFAAAYGHTSRPFPIKPGQKVAVRVISQFGEETTKVLTR